MVVDHKSNLSPSQKSVFLLSSLLLDTHLFAKMSMLIVTLLQCCRHHHLQYSSKSEKSLPVKLILERWGRQLIWLFRFLWPTALKDEEISLSSKLLFWMLLSSFEIPCGQGMFNDAFLGLDNNDPDCFFMALWEQVLIPAAWLFIANNQWTIRLFFLALARKQSVGFVFTFSPPSPFSFLSFFVHSRWCCLISWNITWFAQLFVFAAQLPSWTRGDTRLMRNVGSAWTARRVRIMNFQWIFECILIVPCNLLTWSINRLTVCDSRSCCKEHSFNFCWGTWFCSLQPHLRNSSISWQLLA